VTSANTLPPHLPTAALPWVQHGHGLHRCIATYRRATSGAGRNKSGAIWYARLAISAVLPSACATPGYKTGTAALIISHWCWRTERLHNIQSTWDRDQAGRKAPVSQPHNSGRYHTDADKTRGSSCGTPGDQYQEAVARRDVLCVDFCRHLSTPPVSSVAPNASTAQLYKRDCALCGIIWPGPSAYAYAWAT